MASPFRHGHDLDRDEPRTQKKNLEPALAPSVTRLHCYLTSHLDFVLYPTSLTSGTLRPPTTGYAAPPRSGSKVTSKSLWYAVRQSTERVNLLYIHSRPWPACFAMAMTSTVIVVCLSLSLRKQNFVPAPAPVPDPSPDSIPLVLHVSPLQRRWHQAPLIVWPLGARPSSNLGLYVTQCRSTSLRR